MLTMKGDEMMTKTQVQYQASYRRAGAGVWWPLGAFSSEKAARAALVYHLAGRFDCEMYETKVEAR